MFEFTFPDKLLDQKKELEDTIKQVSEEEKLVLKQLEQIQIKKRNEELALKRIQQELKEREPSTITITRVFGANVYFSIDPFRQVIKEIVNEINKDNNLYEGTQSLDSFEWPRFVGMIRSNPKVSGTKFYGDDHLMDPFWKIKKHKKQLVVQWNPVINPGGSVRMLRSTVEFSNSLPNIPGAYKEEKYYSIPLSEGWRLYEIHPELVSRLCEWESEELLAEVKKAFDKRLRMKEIHTAEDSEYTVDFPNDSNFKLRGHQKVALEFSELTDGLTLIAYTMGTGKTAIAIGDIIRRNTTKNIIVCPGALRLNWSKHLEHLTGEKPVILAGRVPTESDMKFLLVNQPKWIIINYDILRTVSKIPRNIPGIKATEDKYLWVDLLNMYRPDYIVLDECHYTRNHDSNQSKAIRLLQSNYKMALSGTPIMNRPGELWPILTWLYPDLFPFYETFLNQYGAGRSITNVDATKLRSLLETIMLRRTRKDISKDLPPINRIVNTYEISDKARKILDRILMGMFERPKEMDHLGRSEIREATNMLSKLNYMIQVCAVDKVDHTVEEAMELSASLEGEEHNKVLIFTHFLGTCCTIAQKLGHEALSFVNRTPTGFKSLDMAGRMKLVEQFQTDPTVKYMVVTEGTAREGLDLTKAGATVFNDLFWTPSSHRQCEGRAFEREIDLHVGDSYYLQFNDTIEDWITELQGIKDNTIDQVIEGKGIDYSVTNKIIERLKDLWKERYG